MDNQKVVFVSGCFDVLHGGHIEFFNQAKALGDRLVVCVPTDKVIEAHKQRRPAMPIEHRLEILRSLTVVDEVLVGEDTEPGLNFKTHFQRIKPAVLAVTDDDQYSKLKMTLCESVGAKYVRLPKTLNYEAVSTTTIRDYIKAPETVPLRVDFGGGWLDVPRYSRKGSFIVNCTFTPGVSLREWQYKVGGGLGGSAAYKILLGENAFKSEDEAGVGWQDPASINETGLCSWFSGHEPRLACKTNGDWLIGRMALLWTGEPHHTPSLTDKVRNYDLISEAGDKCNLAVRSTHKDIAYGHLVEGVRLSYLAQLQEGMKPLPDVPGATMKYCGGGYGGYAVYLFGYLAMRHIFIKQTPNAIAVEPYIKSYV